MISEKNFQQYQNQLFDKFRMTVRKNNHKEPFDTLRVTTASNDGRLLTAITFSVIFHCFSIC